MALNKLPDDIVEAPSLSSFSKELKIFELSFTINDTALIELAYMPNLFICFVRINFLIFVFPIITLFVSLNVAYIVFILVIYFILSLLNVTVQGSVRALGFNTLVYLL